MVNEPPKRLGVLEEIGPTPSANEGREVLTSISIRQSDDVEYVCHAFPARIQQQGVHREPMMELKVDGVFGSQGEVLGNVLGKVVEIAPQAVVVRLIGASKSMVDTAHQLMRLYLGLKYVARLCKLTRNGSGQVFLRNCLT
jgi:hypothetical protein